MGELYDKILMLCDNAGISGFKLCQDIKMQPSILTDLKMGRTKNLSAKNLKRVACYFGVSVDAMLGDKKELLEAAQNAPKNNEEEDEIVALRQKILDRPEIRALLHASDGAPVSAIYEAAAKLEKYKEDMRRYSDDS